MQRAPLRRLMPLRFPWRGGNRFELLVDGEQFFSRMCAAIEQAQQSVCMEMYLAAPGEVFARFRSVLLAAAGRGVRVRLLFDDFGSLQLNTQERLQLVQQGIDVRFYNRLGWRKGVQNLFRNHRKLLVVDQRIAFTGGAGLTDEFLRGRGNEPAWHEIMVEIRGPAVNDWQLLFERVWRGLRGLLRNAELAAPVPRNGQQPQRGCVVASNGPQSHHVMQSLYKRLKRARTRAWLVTPYFVPSWKLRRRLIQAAARGVDTRVLAPGRHTDHPAIRQASRRHYAKLLRNGVRIFEYQPSFIHAKLALCDQWVSIGSTNFDRWNLRWNLDANQEIDDASFAEKTSAVLEQDFSQSMEVKYEEWQRRSWRWRILELVNGTFDRWLDRLLEKIGR